MLHDCSPTRTASSAAAVVLLLLVSACARPAAPASTSPGPPVELARFYDQDLAFGSCAGYATTTADEKLIGASTAFDCARLEVPLDYTDPGGPSAQIAVLRAPARGDAVGSLVLNSGGPGGPGMGFAATTAAAWAQSPVTERFDLVGFDPRGVAASTPAISCFTDEQYDRDQARTTVVSSAGSWTEDDTRRLFEQCAQGSGGEQSLAHVGSHDTVRDMDLLRAALGEEQLTFLGQSYGTRIGSLYAERFPQRVRAMVLDGAIDPIRDLPDRRVIQYAGFQRSFQQMAADCATRPDCPLGSDPTGATEAFHALVRPLLDRPVPAGDGRQLSYDLAVDGVVSGLYDSAAWPVIIRGLAEIPTGRGDTLLRISDVVGGRGEDGRWSNFLEANLAINCLDEQRLSPGQAVDLKRRIFEAAPFMDPGRGTDGARDACESWPVEPELTYPLPDHVPGLPPTLTISITGDPTTPYRSGVVLAEALGGSLLTVEGERHSIAAVGTSPCVNEIVADYLLDLRTPAAHTRCTL